MKYYSKTAYVNLGSGMTRGGGVGVRTLRDPLLITETDDDEDEDEDPSPSESLEELLSSDELSSSLELTTSGLA